MNKNRLIAAVDIGSFEIKTLIAQVSTDSVTFEKSISIVGYATAPSKGVKKGQIVDIEEAVEATILSVEAAERMAGYNLDRAFVSIDGGHISSQNSTGVVAVSDPDGEVSPNDVERVIEAASAVSLPASRQIIHVLPRDYIVDGESGVKDPVGMTGVRLEVETHLISVSSAATKNLAKTVAEVGIEIEDIVFSGFASAHSVLTDTEKELGCVLVDIGAGTTSVAAYVDGALTYSGVIPIGAKNVTNDIAIGLRVPLEEAEEIKISISDKKEKDKKVDRRGMIDISETGSKEIKKVSVKTLTDGIIRPRLNEVFTIVKLDLERAEIVNKVPSGAIITGGGALTIGAAEAARRSLSLPVRLAVPEGVGGLIDDVQNPRLSSTVGLLIYGANSEAGSPSRNLLSLPKNVRLPNTQSFSKLIETIKDLLP